MNTFKVRQLRNVDEVAGTEHVPQLNKVLQLRCGSCLKSFFSTVHVTIKILVWEILPVSLVQQSSPQEKSRKSQDLLIKRRIWDVPSLVGCIRLLWKEVQRLSSNQVLPPVPLKSTTMSVEHDNQQSIMNFFAYKWQLNKSLNFSPQEMPELWASFRPVLEQSHYCSSFD